MALQPLENQHVVVIGGSSGMGLATAKLAASSGAHVTIGSRDLTKLQAAQKEIGPGVAIKSLDARDEESIEQFFSIIGPFDHLVLSGLPASFGSCLGMDIRAARESFENKFWGQYLSVKHGAPQMSKEGSIVLMSGVLAARPVQNVAIMASVNGAIEALGRSLAIDLAPIRVNVISPGYVDTPLFAPMAAKDRENLFSTWSKKIPIGRVGKPEEIAHAVLYLLTNRYTTGSTLYIDGGYTMR
jgi:NAD(P)-dependent dehydrogenase (short-subunit alcohol dehydrogenase family)